MADQVSISSTLEPGATLQGGRYTVDCVLGQGGFGITYRAFDRVLERWVAMKELFPEGCVRQGATVVPPTTRVRDFGQSRKQFLVEAQLLAQFRHPGIVHIFEVFEEANTAYLVMEYLDGPTYAQRLDLERRLSSGEVRQVLLRSADALRVLHERNLLHRDVKPANLLCVGGQPVLIDFGAARGYTSDQSSAMSRLISQGYSPLEQYAGQARFGPPSDVYSLCATCYHLLTGVIPADAADRIQGTPLVPPCDLVAGVDPALEQAILSGLSLAVTDRPQTVSELIAGLSPTPGVDPVSGPSERRTVVVGAASTSADAPASRQFSPNPESAPSPPKARRNRQMVGVAIGILAAVAVVGVLLARPQSSTKQRAGTSAVTSPAPVDSTVASIDTTSPAEVVGTETVPTSPVTAAVPAPKPQATAAPAAEAETIGPDGDLGVQVGLSRPACHGSWITVLYSAVDPTNYRETVSSYLSRFPGSNYLLTEATCSSLRARFTDGSQIYAVYYGPYASKQQACNARPNTQSYPRILASDVSASTLFRC